MVGYLGLLSSTAVRTQVQGWPCALCSEPEDAVNVTEGAHSSGWEVTSLPPSPPSGIEAKWLWKELRSALPDQKGTLGKHRATLISSSVQTEPRSAKAVTEMEKPMGFGVTAGAGTGAWARLVSL